MENLADLRINYTLNTLLEENTPPSPFILFKKWMEEAVNEIKEDANAFTLSTINKDGYPEGRIVLLKGLTESSFRFFTNYNSQKGKNIAKEPKVSMVFFWAPLQRQVRITGTAKKSANHISDEYFYSRPKASQCGAVVSPQSSILSSRVEMDTQYEKLMKNENGTKRPEHWGGYEIEPTSIEFWQGRPSRLHDRIKYTLQQENSWIKERLAP